MKRMFAAGIDQARGVPYQWDDGWDGYVERFASREGQFIAANSLAALGNAALKYEPRYDQCTCSGFWPRAKHAIMRNFLTYDESERASATTVGAVWRFVWRGTAVDRVETSSAQCVCRGQPRHAGAGGLRRTAEFLHRILARYESQDRRQTEEVSCAKQAQFRPAYAANLG